MTKKVKGLILAGVVVSGIVIGGASIFGVDEFLKLVGGVSDIVKDKDAE